MAITKLLHMNESKGTGGKKTSSSKHLKNAIDYILKPQKTQNGELVGAGNCNLYTAYEDMMDTKKFYNKTDMRQGYHFIVSLLPGEGNTEQMKEIIEKFATEYLGTAYEYVYAVHDDKEHIHAHLIFNSVSRETGLKYHYKNGDWEKHIQPITNKLCKEYGLSEMSFERGEENQKYNIWEKEKGWNNIIENDMGMILKKAVSYKDFIRRLREEHYEIKEQKVLKIKPHGKSKYMRMHDFGENYKEYIENIIKENKLNSMDKKDIPVKSNPPIKSFSSFRYRRYQKLTKFQKLRLRKLYRTGRLRYKNNYNQAWKYKKDILKLQKLKQQYNYILKHRIKDDRDLNSRELLLDEKIGQLNKEQQEIYFERKPLKEAFEMLEEFKELGRYQELQEKGYEGFENRTSRYQEIVTYFLKNKISVEVLENNKQYFSDKLKLISKEKKEIKQEKKLINVIRQQPKTVSVTRKELQKKKNVVIKKQLKE
jgi:Relaxase/Mobilisation nuclease domain.